MTDIIPWQRLIDKIEPFYPNGTSDYGGRKVTDLLLIFKEPLIFLFNFVYFFIFQKK
jgi:hypothetical protein